MTFFFKYVLISLLPSVLLGGKKENEGGETAQATTKTTCVISIYAKRQWPGGGWRSRGPTAVESGKQCALGYLL